MGSVRLYVCARERNLTYVCACELVYVEGYHIYAIVMWIFSERVCAENMSSIVCLRRPCAGESELCSYAATWTVYVHRIH